jgi:hypothetical protein
MNYIRFCLISDFVKNPGFAGYCELVFRKGRSHCSAVRDEDYTGDRTADPSTPLLRSSVPGISVETRGFDGLHAALFTESRTRGRRQQRQAGNSGRDDKARAALSTRAVPWMAMSS